MPAKLRINVRSSWLRCFNERSKREPPVEAKQKLECDNSEMCWHDRTGTPPGVKVQSNSPTNRPYRVGPSSNSNVNHHQAICQASLRIGSLNRPRCWFCRQMLKACGNKRSKVTKGTDRLRKAAIIGSCAGFCSSKERAALVEGRSV
jgi:hypothetical protein